MVPEYWLTEGGQSATGALLDYIVDNHVASSHLANRAASQSKSCRMILFLKIVMLHARYSEGFLLLFTIL